jgi:hypothetical protein
MLSDLARSRSVHADHRALGQVLIYLAHARQQFSFRPVRGVIASFSIPDELRRAVEVMNLAIELVVLPTWMRAAGEVPNDAANAPFV